MRRVNIACIVEGAGEVAAVPILIRRVVEEIDASLSVHVPQPPIRVSRSKCVKQGELERYVELAARKLESSGAILILLDADEDCPAILAPKLLGRARTQRSDMPMAVILAKREYKAWFIAAAASLRGHQGLSNDLQPHANPEEVQGAKEWLRKCMEVGRTYSETVDQPALTRRFDLQAARQASSFDKFYRDIERLLAELDKEIRR